MYVHAGFLGTRRMQYDEVDRESAFGPYKVIDNPDCLIDIADIVLIDPKKESVISAATHAYNTDNNPFEGFELKCGIDKVFLRGNLAVDDGKLVQEKLGKYIFRGKKQI